MQLVNVLFVCMGNICRSPAAEGIFRTRVKEEGLEEIIYIDSAGTSSYHTGEKPDKRMIRHAALRGYDLNGFARGFDPTKDFEKFDYILVMDGENFNNIKALDLNKKYLPRIHMMTDFCKNIKASEVPDPYYEGDQGFELVLDILEDACAGLLDKIKNDLKLN